MTTGTNEGTVAEVARWLESAWRCRGRLEDCRGELIRLESLADSTPTMFSDCENRIQCEVNELIDSKLRIQFIIDSYIRDHTQRIVLELRYVRLYDWDTIEHKARCLRCDVHQVNCQALRVLAEQWPFVAGRYVCSIGVETVIRTYGGTKL